MLSEKGCCLHRIAFGWKEENWYTLFVCFIPFYFKCMQKQTYKLQPKVFVILENLYSGFVLIALIWKRRKSRIKCLQRQFWGFVLSGKNELNLHFHCYCFVVVTWVYKLLWKYFAASEFIMWFHVWLWLSLIWYMMIHSRRLSWHRIRKTKFNYLWKHMKFIFSNFINSIIKFWHQKALYNPESYNHILWYFISFF